MRVNHEVHEREKSGGAQSSDQNDDRSEPERGASQIFFVRPDFSKPEAAGDGPGEQNDFRRAGEHLEGGDESGDDDAASAGIHRLFDDEDDPWEPAERGDVIGPHQAAEREAIEGVGEAGDGGGDGMAAPAAGEEIHSEPGEKKVSEAEKI